MNVNCKHKRGIETAYFYLYCDMVSHLKTFFFRKFLFRTLYGRNRVTTSLYLTPHRQRRCMILPGLQCCVSVLAENYIDSATPEEILANALRQSCRITKTKPKSDEEYLREAHEWLSSELDTPNDK